MRTSNVYFFFSFRELVSKSAIFIKCKIAHLSAKTVTFEGGSTEQTSALPTLAGAAECCRVAHVPSTPTHASLQNGVGLAARKPPSPPPWPLPPENHSSREKRLPQHVLPPQATCSARQRGGYAFETLANIHLIRASTPRAAVGTAVHSFAVDLQVF